MSTTACELGQDVREKVDQSLGLKPPEMREEEAIVNSGQSASVTCERSVEASPGKVKIQVLRLNEWWDWSVNLILKKPSEGVPSSYSPPIYRPSQVPQPTFSSQAGILSSPSLPPLLQEGEVCQKTRPPASPPSPASPPGR